MRRSTDRQHLITLYNYDASKESNHAVNIGIRGELPDLLRHFLITGDIHFKNNMTSL